MNVIEMEIEKLIPYSRNPRININAVDKVAGSLQEFGFQQPIVVDKKNVIIVGHTRYLAAKKLGLTKVPVQIAESLTDTQAKAYRITDNRVGEISEWDKVLLKLELTDLSEMDYNIDEMGFENLELDVPRENEEVAPKEKEFKNKFEVIVECEDESDQEAIYKLMISKGYKCRMPKM